MKNILIAFILFTAVMNSLARSIIAEDEDNGVLGSSSSSKQADHSDFLKITKAPPARVAQPFGSAIELECEAVGSPIPIVEWVHGSGRLSSLDDFETNIISESDPTVMTTVRSRLVIDHQIANERTFTCVARSGSNIVKATTVVHKAPRPLIKSPDSMTDLTTAGRLRPVRITNYFKSVLALIGSNLIIPCKATGRPRGEITWLDNNDNPITGQEPRFKTLASGELLISDLKWADMGSFTCVAKNDFAKDTIQTFIYPLREE